MNGTNSPWGMVNNMVKVTITITWVTLNSIVNGYHNNNIVNGYHNNNIVNGYHADENVAGGVE